MVLVVVFPTTIFPTRSSKTSASSRTTKTAKATRSSKTSTATKTAKTTWTTRITKASLFKRIYVKRHYQFVPFCDFCFFSSLTYSIQATPIAPAKSNIRSFIVSLRASCPCKGISSSSYSVERVVSIYC